MLVVVLSTITNKKQQWIKRKRGDETWICGKGLLMEQIQGDAIRIANLLL